MSGGGWRSRVPPPPPHPYRSQPANWCCMSRSVQDGLYALGKAHVRSTPSLGSSRNVAFQTVPMFVLIDDGPLSSLSRKIDERFFFPRLASPADRWCVPAGSVSSSSTLQIFREASHLLHAPGGYVPHSPPVIAC